MNNNSNRSGVKILGFLLIVSGLISVYFDYLFPSTNHGPLSLLLINFSSSFAIFPRGVPWFLQYFPQSFVSLGFMFIFFWRVCVMLCGIGILFHKNIARIGLIIFSVIHIIAFAFSKLLMVASHRPIAHYASGNNMIDALAGINYNFFVWLLPVIYIIYLVLPKIRREFK